MFMPVAPMLQHVVFVYLAKMAAFAAPYHVSPSWGCALFRKYKTHLVLVQRRMCDHVKQSGL
jgi:hypothetical protein